MRLLLALILALLLPVAPAEAATDGDPRALALHRINIAGRQRMLSQRIAMAAWSGPRPNPG